MKILLTGANGFLGRHIRSVINADALLTLGRTEGDVICDLATDIPVIEAPLRTVIHAAGLAHFVPKGKKAQEKFYNVNLKITQNLIAGLEKSRFLPQSFVFISTVAVYGVESGSDIDENYPLLGHTPYALSKIKSEELLLDWGKKNGVKILIVRLPLVVGENPPGNLGAMIKGIRKGYYFRFNEGLARKSVVSAQDVARCIRDNGQAEGIYNLTDLRHPTLREIENVIALKLNKRILKIPKKIIEILGKFGDYFVLLPINSPKINKLNNSLTFSSAKAVKYLNWHPKSALEDLIV